jgi:hypothetical protein
MSASQRQQKRRNNAGVMLTWLRAVKISWREALRRTAAYTISILLLPRSTIVTLLWLRHRCFKQCFVVSSRFYEFLVQLLKVIWPASVCRNFHPTPSYIPFFCVYFPINSISFGRIARVL